LAYKTEALDIFYTSGLTDFPSSVLAGNSKCFRQGAAPLRLSYSVIGQQHLPWFIAYNRNNTAKGIAQGCQNIMGFSWRSRPEKKGLPLKWNKSPRSKVQKNNIIELILSLGSEGYVEPKVRARVPPSVLDSPVLSLLTVYLLWYASKKSKCCCLEHKRFSPCIFGNIHAKLVKKDKGEVHNGNFDTELRLFFGKISGIRLGKEGHPGCWDC
jgi:hypothetical protein